MGARTKLNGAYVNGALVAATVVGLAFDSWSAFVAIAGVFMALAASAGHIRG